MLHDNILLQFSQVYKSYLTPDKEEIPIIENLNLSFQQGTTNAIIGPSGSGKTTFLSMIIGMEKPDAGDISVNQVMINRLSAKALIDFRAKNMSTIFQNFYLIPYLNALQNVMLPMEILKMDNIEQRAMALLSQVNLQDRANHLPSQMSGGENQRVCIARSLATEPSLLLADEPTGNLDVDNREALSEMLFGLVKDNNLTLILVTHDMDLAKECEQIYQLKNKHLVNVIV